MTTTQFLNWLYNGICLAIAVGSELLADSDFLAMIPPKYKHAVAVLSMVAMIYKSKNNLKINRDGTPDSVPYQPKTAQVMPGEQMAMKQGPTPKP